MKAYVKPQTKRVRMAENSLLTDSEDIIIDSETNTTTVLSRKHTVWEEDEEDDL